MAVDLKQSPAKDLLQHGAIRTMRKDLARLREEDSLEEKQKISKIRITNQEPAEIELEPMEALPVPPKVVAPLPPKSEFLSSILADKSFSKTSPEDKLGKILQEVKQEHDDQSQVKDHATESEKQQIFLLQSKRADLQKEITKGDQQNNVMSEKNRLLSQRKDWQDKLDSVLQEQKNAQTQGQKEDIEKKKWSVETELVRLEGKIKAFDQSNEQSGVAQNNIKAEIADIDDSLKAIYANISQREKTVKQEPVAVVPKAPEKRTEIFTAPVTREQVPMPPKSTFEEKEYLKKVPVVAMEKLIASTQVEEKQRLKFMDDVEKWVAQTKSQDQNNN